MPMTKEGIVDHRESFQREVTACPGRMEKIKGSSQKAHDSSLIHFFKAKGAVICNF